MYSSKILYIILLFLITLFACKNKSEEQTKIEIAENIKKWLPSDLRNLNGVGIKRGLTKNSTTVTPGYILFNASASTSTHLMNKKGEIVHTWTGELNSMQTYLKENGNLVRLERDPDFPVFAAGGQAGRIREYTWDGDLVWDFKLANAKNLLHHDIELMANGNILGIAYDAKSHKEIVAAGRDPKQTPKGGVWLDKIIEIKPNYPSGGDIVWEWKMSDHLIQDFDSKKPNYGSLISNPRKLTINAHRAEGPPMTAEQIDQMKAGGMITSNASLDTWGSDIVHTNAIFYNEALDQIAISSPEYSEIYIIDHSTTTAEARGSKGGRWRHGGELLFRWGNPQNYGAGDASDRQLYGQHDIRWIADGYRGAGHLMVFNNDIPHPDNKFPSMWALIGQMKGPKFEVKIEDLKSYSSVFEIAPQMDGDGNYTIGEKGRFEPNFPIEQYMPKDTFSLYSAFISGARPLPNNHLLVLNGADGRMIEMNEDNEVIWEYYMPYFDNYKLPDGTPSQPMGPFLFGQFRIDHIAEDFPGLRGKKLTALTPQPEPYNPKSM